MNFAWPLVLWLLAAPAGLLLWEANRRIRSAASPHPKILQAHAGRQDLRLGGPAGPARRLHGWLAVGLALAVVALARPQWGRIDEPSFDQSREILIALDLSRSMMTPDIKPTRLDRAKLLIQSLLDRLSGERVGLIDFSGTAFLQAPLSADYEILGEFLPSLAPDYMPEGGTNYGALLDTAAAAFSEGSGADRYLIILSDGGATDEDWRSHISKLTDKGVRVIGLGLGTAAGAFIPDGSGGFVKDESGAVVMARLESGTLRELAEKTGGAYRDANGWIDLPALLHATIEAGRKGRFVEKNDVRYVERFQWFLAPALLCLLLSFWQEFPVRPRPRDLRAPGPAGTKRAAAVAAALAAAFLLAPRAPADETGGPNDAALLSHVVGRLSAADHRTASDWAELSSETVAWGQRVQSERQAVPAGPVHDGLAAVDAGSALDARAADWPKLRSELQGFLQKPPEDKPPPQKQNQQNQQQQNQQQNSGSQQDSSGQPQPQQQNQPQNSSAPPQKQNAANGLGNMSQPQQPPPPSSAGTQKVGGRPERSEREPGSSDPALEASIEKLNQIRDQDSPAQLFQMIQNNEPHPPAKPGKNW